MLFYPIEYLGVDWYRQQHSPFGLIGWQGVVPTKTEQMASRLVDIVTRRLLSLSEAFGRLQPSAMARLLTPCVVQSVQEECGPYWAALLRPVLPTVLTILVRRLQGEIEDVLDLRSVVLSAFVRDKEVLVDLFQKVGKVELEFLVESGLGFGAALGAPKWALESSGGVLNRRARAPEGSRERSEPQNRDFAVFLVFPKRSRRYVYIGFSDLLKNVCFFKLSPMGFPGKLKEGLGRYVLRSSGFPGGPRES